MTRFAMAVITVRLLSGRFHEMKLELLQVE